jgi:hypothetical protein
MGTENPLIFEGWARPPARIGAKKPDACIGLGAFNG